MIRFISTWRLAAELLVIVAAFSAHLVATAEDALPTEDERRALLATALSEDDGVEDPSWTLDIRCAAVMPRVLEEFENKGMSREQILSVYSTAVCSIGEESITVVFDTGTSGIHARTWLVSFEPESLEFVRADLIH